MRLIPQRPRRARALDAIARNDLAVRHSPRRTAAVAAGIDFARDLSRAVELGQLSLQYQPIVHVRTGTCSRVEVLLRWEHPQAGPVPPLTLLLIAESLGLLPQIGRFVLGAALRQREAWLAQDLKLGLTVNLSAPELADPQLADRLAAVLRSERVEPGEVTLELPASALHGPEALEMVRQFTHAGVRLSLDGLNASPPPSRSVLRLVHELKVSPAVVIRAVADPGAALVLRSTVELARDLGLTVVAVGVEDRATHDLVASLDCDDAQGYFMSRPLLAQDLVPWRAWVAQAAFAGSMAASAHAGASGASAAGSQIAERLTLKDIVPTCCVLSSSGSRVASETDLDGAAMRAEFEKRTRVALVSVAGAHADLLTERAITQNDQRRLALALDESVIRIEREYGRAFTRRPAVYVFSTRASFSFGLEQGFGYRGSAPGVLAAASGGVTLVREGVIAINWANVSAAGPLAILRHELTHAMVHQIVGPEAQLPAWVDEGLATLAERDEATGTDSAISRDPYVVLSLLTNGQGSLRDLASPADWLVQNAKIGGEGYRVAGAAVGLMQQRLGPGGLLHVLEATGRREDFTAAYARAAGEALTTFAQSFPARLAAAHASPVVTVVAAQGGVRYMLSGFPPGTDVEVSIKGVDYDLRFSVTADRYGLFTGVFGATAPPGEYRLTATGRGGTVSALLMAARLH